MTLTITTICSYTEGQNGNLFIAMLNVIMLNVIMLSVILLSVIMLSVVILSVVMLSAIMLSAIMLSVVMLSVVAPVRVMVIVSHFHSYLILVGKAGAYPSSHLGD
jgi:hypothetical protein